MTQTKAYNFRDIFRGDEQGLQIKDIVIPIIQRDYAQGREIGNIPRIRSRFLKVLYNALVEGQKATLDFIYGNVNEDGQLIPLDGQQRLTTLFLLHYYIARHEAISGDEWEFLHHFTYETRVSSREFCQHLIRYTPDFKLQTLSEQIQDEAWFLLEWESDPTVKSMLVMLDAIHTMFHDTYGLWQKLMGDAITFYFLPLGDLGVTDELYIKMNSRGKPLTNFEHFKAELELQMKEVVSGLNEDDAKIAGRIIRKMDREWSNLLWPYRNSETGNQQADTVIDDEFLRYIRFISNLISYQNGEQELTDEFDIIEKQFSKSNPQALSNMKRMESLFDIWTKIPNIDAFFNDYLYVSEYAPGKSLPDYQSSKTKIESLSNTKKEQQTNLFLDCCAHYGIVIGKRPQFPLGRFILLYCFILKLQHQEQELSDMHFRSRLRIVSNLVNNSVNTLRSDYMKELLVQVEKIILLGIVEQVEEGKARFQSKQMAEERLKLQWTQEHSEIAETLCRLEDHPYLNGYINAVVGEKWENVKWCDRFYSLFNCNHHNVNKALLAIGDFFEKDAWRYQIGIGDFVVNRNVKDRMWQELFSPVRLEDSLCAVLQQLLSQRETFDDDYLNELSNAYLQEAKEYPLRYYIVKYDSMRTNRDGRYNNYGKYYWRHHNDWPKKDEKKQKDLRLKDYDVILMTTEWSLGGYNHDLFLKTLYDLAGGESAGLVLDNYSYTRYNETIDGQKGADKLRMSNGNYMTLADNVYKIYDEKNELLDSHQIVQNDAGIDIEERVEIGLQMIKKRIL